MTRPRRLVITHFFKMKFDMYFLSHDKRRLKKLVVNVLCEGQNLGGLACKIAR